MSLHRLSRDAVKPAVGREIDSWCTRCKLDLGHTITAMVSDAVVQVRCNTCGSVHKYRSPAAQRANNRVKSSTAGARSKARAKVATVSAEVRRFQQRIANRDISAPTRYSPRLDPDVGELIEHVKFGLGIVEAVSDDKATVLFESGLKTLVIGR